MTSFSRNQGRVAQPLGEDFLAKLAEVEQREVNGVKPSDIQILVFAKYA